MKEMDDKLSAEDKAKLSDELEAFKKVREGGKADEIKSAMEKFTQVSYDIFGKVYQAAQAEQQAQQGGAQGSTVDADYTVEDN